MLPDAAVDVHDRPTNVGLLRTHVNAKTRRADRLRRELGQTLDEIEALERRIADAQARRSA